MPKVTAVSVPIRRTAQILTQSKTSDNDLKPNKVWCALKKDCCLNLLFLPRGRSLGGFQSVHGKANVLLGAVPVLCACCAETPPQK